MIQILIVDDMKALLEAVKFVLESNPGFRVDTALSVKDALGLLQTTRYDVIISDYCMPEMNGIEFLRHLRAQNCTIPFILQTGQGDEKTAMEALECGVDFFLEKGSEGPLQFLAFTQVINLLVSNRRACERMDRQLKKFHRIFEKTDAGLVFIDERGQVQDVNPAFLEMTGYSAGEIRDLTYHQLIPGKWDTFNPDSLRSQVLSTGYSDEYALEYVHKNGMVIPITIRAVAGDDHDRTGCIWFFIRRSSR